MGSSCSCCSNIAINPYVIDWDDPLPIIYGCPLSAWQLNAEVHGIEGEFVYSPDIGTILSHGNHKLHVIFTPTNNKKTKNRYHAPITKTVMLYVDQVTPIIIWKPINLYDTMKLNKLYHLNAVVINEVDGIFQYSVSEGAVLEIGQYEIGW